ncbi:hypothetical protein DY000_02005524 [Brassica cretica]|uniref:Uncharacterized protein n=1 Tax=Brassica cretica TaxID=69181 RepID=A0ABQ7CCC7_BRACR|nr:hypothetical protein DY000_02005524 [Brassica cretica]
MAGRSKSSKRARLYESDSEQISDHEVYFVVAFVWFKLFRWMYGEDDHSIEKDDDVGSDEGDNEEDDVVEKAKNLMI